MKNILSIGIFLLSIAVVSQDFQGDLTSDNDKSPIDAQNSISYNQSGNTDRGFQEASKSNNIPQRTLTNIEGAMEGYYVVSGVFSKSNKLNRQVRQLNRKGFDSGYIQNPENKLYYLYLNRYDNWQKAIADYNTGFNGKYDKETWILNVENNSSPIKEIALEEVTYDMLQESKSVNEDSNLQMTSLDKKQINTKPNKTQLIKRADEYFDKMWYAEAAKLYEMALNKNKDNYSYEVLQKIGDAYYFNTNMEQAYKWYNIMYENYSAEMSSDNIFKYAHSLKGTGKYGRSKRLMRLYTKKNSAQLGNADLSPEQREIMLDRLLSMTDKFDVKNISINTKYSEFSPAFYNEGEVVFASSMDSSVFNTRRYKWNNQPYLDLYTAKLNEESQELKDAVKFSKKINTKYHEASVAFTPDNKTMFFTRNNYGKKLKRDKNGINNLKIYRSEKIDGEWTEAKEVSFNSDSYSTGHPAISPDGKKLYFVSDMPGSIGETDIFVVDRMEDGSFSEPRNLGPGINTEKKEMFPFVNNEKLYFSSNGYVGMGGLDVYEAPFDKEGGFLKVKNLGKPINSNKDDFSFIIKEESKMGFFASNRGGGKGFDDIYSFKTLKIEEVPAINNVIAGVVTELITGDIMPKALVTLLDENNIKLKEIETEEDGSFIFEDLDANTKYTLKSTKGSYFDDEKEITTVDNDTINVDIQMRKLKEMIAVENGIRKLKTEMIHFNFDKYDIRQDASKELDKLVNVMKEYPNMVIKIESHTDSRGSKVYNKYLSDKRAKSTREYIISQGVAAERIQSAIGYGEEKLLNNCNGSVRCTEQKHYLNRRSEFIIVDM
ncbi:OmpA family protein [Maribacter sp. PR1]|uniref:OmpA family protein n=1 Tax=Maribacter cobaltidurans TaxID=1178778 RepID=A0ABU7IQG8_9FLAO|nr:MULTISPECIES: OmpA family protein [Maribacter]MDC6387812.1 OmpA family protein [Maribacter sp. PR1]MEE1975200.1 OmpA family protein [Maribacter cobaltidurans]